MLDRHEAAGTTDSEEYQTAHTGLLTTAHCRLDPWPEPFQRSISQMNMVVYEQMYGPNDFTVTGSEKDYDLTDRLDRLDVPVLFL